MKAYILLFVFFQSLSFLQGKNPNFEFSGIDKFWDIIRILERNDEPTEKEWKSLFNTPGYKVLTRREFSQKFFKDNFRLVFQPKKKKELEIALKNGKNRNHLLHYKKVRDNKQKIKDQLRKLKNNNYSRIAVKRTLEYLPQNRVSTYPPVSFVIFESNGRGSSPIVVDLAASIEWDFMSFLSHEYHHWYRNKQIKINERKVANEDKLLIDVLGLIEAEGIADMIDKKDWYTKPSNSISDYARRFIHDVKRTPEIIKILNDSFEKLIKNPKQKSQIGRKILNSLPQRGHTTGYFMARMILEKFSKRELAKCVGNPFDFILLYNRAALKSSGRYPSFSNESINFIKTLKSKYSI